MNAAMVKIFAELETQRSAVSLVPMRQRFADDPGRFQRMAISLGNLLLDYSKNLVDDGVLANLIALAEASEI